MHQQIPIRRLRSTFGQAFFAWLVLLVTVLSTTSSAQAQLPVIELSTIFPPGCQQGQSVEVKVAGANQDDLERLIFSHTGITATQKIREPDEFRKSAESVPGEFIVKVSPDTPFGIYEVRAVGRFGTSNPRAFVVGGGEELVDDGGNKSFENAREIPIGTTVNGTIDAATIDYYKISLKQGQRVLIECFAQRIDSRLDGAFAFYDESGKELLRRRAFGTDPLIDFTSPVDGNYVVALYDFVYAGGSEHFYRLIVHQPPHIDLIFPPSGLRGQNSQFTVYGRNLPSGKPVEGMTIGGSPLEQATVTISLPNDGAAAPSQEVIHYVSPASAMFDWFAYRLGNSNTVPVYLADAPVVIEQEPNDSSDQAQKINVPAEIAGRFAAKDVDWFAFEGKKGDVFQIEVIANRMGLSCDPYMLIQKVVKNDKDEESVSEVAQLDDPPNQNNPIPTDFDAATYDPSYKLEVKEDATYRIMVRDQFANSQADPRSVYRLVVRREQPDFRLLAFHHSLETLRNGNAIPPCSPVLRRGDTTAIIVKLDRQDGFEGDVQVDVEGLPGGVKCSGAVLGGAADSTWLVIAAEENAAAWTGPIRIVGRTKIAGKDVVRQATYGTVVHGTTNRGQQPARYRIAPNITMSVTDKETADVFVQLGDEKVLEMALGGKLEVSAKAIRRNGHKENMKLRALGLPGEIQAKEFDLNGGATDGKLNIELGNANAKPGLYTFPIWADVKIKYARNPEAIARAETRQKELEQIVKDLEEKFKQADAARNKAVQVAQEAQNQRNQAEQNKNNAANAAQQAANTVTQAEQKLAAAKQALEGDKENQGLKDALASAEKARNEVVAKKNEADQKRKDAEKALADAEAANIKAKEEAAKAEQTRKEAEDRQNKAKQLKGQADQDFNNIKNANQPKDIQIAVVSTPIRLRVVETPVEVQLQAPGPLKQAGKVEVPITVTRKYGFEEQVEVFFESPPSGTSVPGNRVAIPKGQTAGKMEISANENAAVGQHTAKIRIQTRFGNVTKSTYQELTLTIVKGDQ